MRFSYRVVICTLLMLSYCGNIIAQKIIPSDLAVEGLEKFMEDKSFYEDAKLDDFYYLKLTFETIPSKEERASLENNKIKLLTYKGNNTYTASLPAILTYDQLEELRIIGITKNKKTNKLDSYLSYKDYPEWIRKGTKLKIAIIFHEGIPEEKTHKLLENFDIQIVHWLREGHILTAIIDEKNIDKLATSPLVAAMQAAEPPVQALNYENSILQKTQRLSSMASGGLNLQGTGVVIGVGDGGELGDHIDFGLRTINLADGTYSPYGIHGDHVSGTIGGGGIINPRHRGLAPDCTLLIEKTTNITYNSAEYFDTYGMVITNNSYGVGPDCVSNGAYNYSSINLDKQMRLLPKMLHLFAAGNSGMDNCENYPTGYKTVLRYYGAAKNVLTVGAVDEERKIGNLSSRGPVADGRLKPEICGVGINVMSTGRDYDYHKISGTSMATPSVAASIGLMYQLFRQENGGETPDGGLMKVIACNTADDVGNKGPDYVYGYGIMNAQRAADVIIAEQYETDVLSNGEEYELTLEIPAGLKQAKIMLYWHDTEADIEAEKTLVNNLDLQLLGVEMPRVLPWVLDPNPTKVNHEAKRGVDNINNIEQITLDNPNAGFYVIKVIGKEIPFDDQRFYLTYDFVTDDVSLNHPFGEEQLLPNTKELIHWDAAPNNTEKFKIEYSNNGGIKWEVLFDEVPADQRSIEWNVPDEITAQGQIRISKIGSELSDINEVYFSILGRPDNLSAQPICDGYMELIWDGVNGAIAYEVLMFDGELMKTKEIVEETTILLSDDFVDEEAYWFSVQAIGEGGNKSLRTEAVMAIAESDEACPWDDDSKIEYLAPIDDGRQLTNTALGSESISINIKNVGNTTMENFEVSYNVNGTDDVTEIITDEILPSESQVYTFSEKVNFSNPGVYEIDTWLASGTDNYNQNDSVIGLHKIEQLSNPPVEWPYYEDFETAPLSLYDAYEIGLENLDPWDFVAEGVAALEIKRDLSQNSIMLASNNQSTSNALLTLNLEQHTYEDGLLLTFEYKAEEDNPDNNVWVRASDTDEWIIVGNLTKTIDYDYESNIDLSQLLMDADQALSPSFQLKFTQHGNKPIYIKQVRIDNYVSQSVSLLSFEAEQVEENVLLSWQTLNEKDNKRFEVEVANENDFENNEFRRLSRINSQGDNESVQAYVYVDVEPNKMGIRYYRLKIVDKYNNFYYSDVQEVIFEAPIEESVAVYPNPFRNDIRVQLASEEEQVVTIELRDAVGRLLFIVEEKVSNGNNDFLYAFGERLTRGLYFLNLKTNTRNYTYKLTKQ